MGLGGEVMGLGRRLLSFVTMICFMVMIIDHGYAQTETSSATEIYRIAAEEFKGIARMERARRVAAEQDAADARAVADVWREAAATPQTPAWVWPTFAGSVIAAFIIGVVVATRLPRPVNEVVQ